MVPLDRRATRRGSSCSSSRSDSFTTSFSPAAAVDVSLFPSEDIAMRRAGGLVNTRSRKKNLFPCCLPRGQLTMADVPHVIPLSASAPNQPPAHARPSAVNCVKRVKHYVMYSVSIGKAGFFLLKGWSLHTFTIEHPRPGSRFLTAQNWP